MLVSTSWFCSGPSKLTPLFSRSQDCHQACCEEAPCLRTQVPRGSTHGGLSSDSEGRASKVHKQCGTCRPSGTPRRRVRKAGRRQRSKGCRVAWEGRSQWGRISGAAHLIQTMTVSTLRHRCTSPAFHCFSRPHLCLCCFCGLPADPYPQLHSRLCVSPLVYG